MAVSKTLFDQKLVTDVINKVRGKSSLAALGTQAPVPFVGSKEFVFTMDADVDIVAENGKFSHGGITMDPVIMVPIKFEYGARVSDEFIEATEEEKINILTQFNEGFAKKLAAGLDKAAMHGINPRSGKYSAVVGNNCFDKKVTAVVAYTGADQDEQIETAISTVEGNDMDVTGIAISSTMRNGLANLKNTAGDKRYPEFAFGGQPANLGANKLSINSTVSAKASDTGTVDVDHAIVGDFDSMFKWGYGKEITLEVIEYGDPDNTGADLKGNGQVYLRATAYLGWAIFAGEAFARVRETKTNA